MIIDITKKVWLPRHKEKESIKSQMISWFEQNIGPFSKEPDLDNSIYTGNGWKWFKHVIYDTGSHGKTISYTTYFVEIDDERVATMFRLKFL